MRSAAALWTAAAVVPPAAVATALVTQHVFGLLPCPWCVLQRLIFLAIAAVALVALLWRAALPRRVLALAMLALAGSGVAAAVWQHRLVGAGVSCNLTLADRVMTASGLDQWLPEVFAAYASCADAAVKLLGVPYEFYSGTLFVLLALAALALIRQPR